MKILLRILQLFLLSIITLPSYSAEADSLATTEIDSTAVYYFVGSIDSLALGKLHHIDTTLTKFHQFDASFKNNNYFAGKGNLGQHSTSLKFDYSAVEGFNYNSSALDLYSYKNSEVKYFQLTKPFIELYFVQGPEKEKTLEVTHTQNIMPRLNVGIKFRYITAAGLYQHQKTDNKNLFITLRYRTANSRYGFILNYLHNKLETEENGGITNDTLFNENIETDRLIIPVNLNEARNIETQNGFYLNHYFNIGKPKTVVKDSLENTIERKGFSFGRLTHTIQYQKTGLSFWDNMNSTDSTYFQSFDLFDPMLDAVTTFDTISISKFENQITWSNLDYDDNPENKPLYLYFGLKSQIISISDTLGKQESTNQLILKGGFSVYAFKSSRLNVNGYYVLGGYNSSNFSLNASLSQYLGTKEKNWGMLMLESAYIKKRPDWFYTYHQGNNIRWNFDDEHFNEEKIFYFKAHYKYKGLYLGASYFKLDDYIYLDETAHPVQSSTSLLSANLRYDLQLGNWNFDIDLVYQKNKENIISVPEFLGSLSIYYTKSIFQKVAILQPGIEFFYNTSYYADAYMPAIRSYYAQSDMEIGNKIYADLFLNVKIKRTLFFLRYHHANASFSKAYYMTPHYPMQDAALRFGISWRFYD